MDFILTLYTDIGKAVILCLYLTNKFQDYLPDLTDLESK